MHDLYKPQLTHEYSPFGTPQSEIIDDLPSDEETIATSVATLVFIPQAWVDERAVETDAPRHEFEVPLDDLRSDGGDWFINGNTSHYVSDVIATHENNRDRYKNYDGPFEIKVIRVEINAPIDDEDVVVVSESALGKVVDAAREECRQLDDIPDVPAGRVEELDTAITTVEQALDTADPVPQPTQ